MNLEPNQPEPELTQLEQAIASQEAVLSLLPPAQRPAAEAILAALRRQRSHLLVQVSGSGAISQGSGDALGQKAVKAGDVGGDIVTGRQIIVHAEEGATVTIGEAGPVEMDAVARESALGRYLTHIIATNRYLQLQGIRSGGRLVHIELEQIYVALRATQQRTVAAEEAWLAAESALAPGEGQRPAAHRGRETVSETVTVSVNEALAQHQRIVVLGDPGSGKTTLLRYLALVYGRDLAQRNSLVPEKLGLAESGVLPILMPLRQIGGFLRTRAEESVEGHRLLLEFLHHALANERIDVPLDFFDPYLAGGRAAILLDGLDEVAGSDLRRRVARLVEAFSRAYPQCRLVVTSRIVGYSGAARLGEGYVTTTVRDFTLADVEQFLAYWHRLVAAAQMGPGQNAETVAAVQTEQLMTAIKANERVRELAINPLMLTVIALVHRDRVKLPDRRAELYAEAVDVLLGKWDEARGVTELAILEGKPFDTGDKRLLLQTLALRMHESQQKEIEASTLRRLLFDLLLPMTGDNRAAERANDRFLQAVEERSGLLVARDEGVYAFSHLTFQEYLAALAIAGRDDYITYTLSHTADPWWREVILLAAGYLSTQSKERTGGYIQAIADKKEEPEPYHNLVLAAECLRDAGENRVTAGLTSQVQQRLRQGLETPPSILSRWLTGKYASYAPKGWIERRSMAMAALVQVGAGYWTQPYGEPEWIPIPAGEFWMGSDTDDETERPLHRLHLDEFHIARVPITNAQYRLFVQATSHEPPRHWQDGRPPRQLESHPVTTVTWRDATAYCRWLSSVTGKAITLPSEAEWEKAARGDKDKREYPWGDNYDRMRCDGPELGIGTTTPVGIFPTGASPYGVLDMSGNVLEWTRSLYGKRDGQYIKAEFRYPYQAKDGREDLSKGDEWLRVLRGGAYNGDKTWLRCAYRDRGYPDGWSPDLGMRLVASPSAPLASDSSGL